MYKMLCGALGLAALGLVGYVGYSMYVNDNNAYGEGDDDYWAGLNFGITGWKPELPIHPKAMAPTEAVYSPFKVVGHSHRLGEMMPARSNDYYNPSQIVPTTGPGNLAPIAGVNTGWVNADMSPYVGTDTNTLWQGAWPKAGNTPNINPTRSVVTGG